MHFEVKSVVGMICCSCTLRSWMCLSVYVMYVMYVFGRKVLHGCREEVYTLYRLKGFLPSLWIITVWELGLDSACY